MAPAQRVTGCKIMRNLSVIGLYGFATAQVSVFTDVSGFVPGDERAGIRPNTVFAARVDPLLNQSDIALALRKLSHGMPRGQFPGCSGTEPHSHRASICPVRNGDSYRNPEIMGEIEKANFSALPCRPFMVALNERV